MSAGAATSDIDFGNYAAPPEPTAIHLSSTTIAEQLPAGIGYSWTGQSYEERLREIVRAELGSGFASYLWPESGDGLPDNRTLKLVVLRPEDSGTEIAAWIERKGETMKFRFEQCGKVYC